MDDDKTRDTQDPQGRSGEMTLLQFVIILFGGLLLLATFFFVTATTDRRNGCPVRLHPRSNAVNPASILRLEIPEDAPIPAADLRDQERIAPGPSGVNLLMQRAQSAVAAGEIFDDLCQNGWSHESLNELDKSHFSYGGDNDQRYCASQLIQNRFSMGYAPGCGSSSRYISYVIVQRGDAIFAAYEAAYPWEKTGRLTNEALFDSMYQLRLHDQ